MKNRAEQDEGINNNNLIVTDIAELEDINPNGLEEYDSEEERIMQKELEKRKNMLRKTEDIQEDTPSKTAVLHGEYREIVQDDFLKVLLKNPQVVCHFYQKDFERCKIMDKHLEIIAKTHPETLFVKIDAEKSPFFTNRLNIYVLPTVIFSKDGKAYDRLIGFEGLGDADDFATINLSRRLVRAKIISAKNKAEKGDITLSKLGRKKDDFSDSDEN